MWIFNRKNSKLKALALGIGAALFSGGVASADIVIDSFNTPPGGQHYTTNASASYSDTGPISEIIGGRRDYSLQFNSGTGTFIIDINQDNPGVASLYSPTLAQGDFIFDYGATADLNVDLSTEVAFVVKMIDADLNGTLTLTVRSGANTASKTVVIPTSASTIVLGFNQFPGIDFTDVDQLTYLISGPNAYDVAIDHFGTMVPVPSAVWAGLGLIGVVGVRRMRRFQNA